MIMGLVSLKGRSVEEAQIGVDTVVLSPKSLSTDFGDLGWKVRQDFYVRVLRQSFFFTRRPQFLCVRHSADPMGLIRIIQGNLTYS